MPKPLLSPFLGKKHFEALFEAAYFVIRTLWAMI